MEFFLLILFGALASSENANKNNDVVEAPQAEIKAPDVVVAEPKMQLGLFSNTENGVETTSLTFGVPETDNALFTATCSSNDVSPYPINLSLYAPFGDVQNESAVSLLMTSGKARQSYSGTYRVLNEEKAAGNFVFAANDPVLLNAAQTGVLEFKTVVGTPSIKAEMPDANNVLTKFLADCARHATPVENTVPQPTAAETGSAGDGQTVKLNESDEVAVAPDQNAIAWRRSRFDLGEFNEANIGLRGSVLTAIPNGQSLPVFRAYCSETTIEGARTKLQFFSSTALPVTSEEQSVYVKFGAGEEYLENVLTPLDGSFSGVVESFQDAPVVQFSFDATARFWTAMEVGGNLLYQINSGEPQTISLDATGRSVSRFINDCLTYDKSVKAKIEAEKQASETPAEAAETAQPQQQVAQAPQVAAPTTPEPTAPAPAPELAPAPAPEGNIELPAAADPTKRWMASRGTYNNLRSSFLRYGASGGGETEFIAVCSEGNAAISSVSTWHFINDFPGEANNRIKLTYVVDGQKLTTAYGEVFDDGDGYKGVREKNAPFSKFYQGLAASAQGSLQVGDLGALEIPLDGSAQPMAFFAHDCKTLRDEAKEALKAAGNDKTPPEDPNWHNLSRTIGAALQAEEKAVIVDQPLPDNLKWTTGQASYNNKPFSYVRLDHKGYNVPSVFAVCNASSSKISNVQFWFAMDAGAASAKSSIVGNYVFADDKQRKIFRPFGKQGGYRGVAASMPYFGSFWRTAARNGVLGLALDGVETPAQYPLGGGHKMMLQLIEDCRGYREQAKETEKTTGVEQVNDLVDPNQLIQLASIGGVQPQPDPVAPTQQTAASAVGGIYRCDNGRQIEIALAPQNTAAKVDYQGLPTMQLPSIDNNAGSSFSDGFFTLLANEAEARLVWGNTTRICKR